MEKLDYITELIKELFDFSESPIKIITILIFCVSLIIIYFILRMTISCSKKNNRIIYFLPIHLLTFNLPSYFLKLGIMQILSLSAPIMPFISYFFYCSYKAIFFSLLYLLLSGFMSLTFKSQIILLFNTYYCIVFLFEIISEYCFLILFLLNMSFFVIFLREVKIYIEYIVLIFFALKTGNHLLKKLKEQIYVYHNNIINIVGYNYKIHKLKSYILFTLIYSFLRIILGIALVFYIKQFYFEKNLQILVCENLFSTTTFIYDAVFLFIFLIMIFPEKYPEGYLDEVILLDKSKIFKSDLSNQIKLENMNKDILLECKTNKNPILILSPYSINNPSLYDNLYIGFIENSEEN